MAKNEINAILYSLTESPSHIEVKRKDGNIGWRLNPKSKGRKSAYDLLNGSVIKLDGTIQQCSHEYYDSKFVKEINRLENHKIQLFLEHHFEKTTDKKALLKRIDGKVLHFSFNTLLDEKLQKDKEKIVAEWVWVKKDNRKTIFKYIVQEKKKLPPPVKANSTQLKDFFENDSSYKKGLCAIEKVILDKHKNFRRGKMNNIATTFLLFNNRKLLRKGSAQYPFSKALAIHYRGSIAEGSIDKGAYTEETAIELEKYLK